MSTNFQTAVLNMNMKSENEESKAIMKHFKSMSAILLADKMREEAQYAMCKVLSLTHNLGLRDTRKKMQIVKAKMLAVLPDLPDNVEVGIVSDEEQGRWVALYVDFKDAFEVNRVTKDEETIFRTLLTVGCIPLTKEREALERHNEQFVQAIRNILTGRTRLK